MHKRCFIVLFWVSLSTFCKVLDRQCLGKKMNFKVQTPMWKVLWKAKDHPLYIKSKAWMNQVTEFLIVTHRDVDYIMKKISLSHRGIFRVLLNWESTLRALVGLWRISVWPSATAPWLTCQWRRKNSGWERAEMQEETTFQAAWIATEENRL